MKNPLSKLGSREKQRLRQEYFVWLTTVGSDLTPHPRPVWFIWEHGSFLVFSQPQAHKISHLTRHPAVALHFNADQTADHDVLVFIGTAAIDSKVPPADQVPAYLRKYGSGIAGLDMTPADFGREYSVAIRITPAYWRSL